MTSAVSMRILQGQCDFCRVNVITTEVNLITSEVNGEYGNENYEKGRYDTYKSLTSTSSVRFSCVSDTDTRSTSSDVRLSMDLH